MRGEIRSPWRRKRHRAATMIDRDSWSSGAMEEGGQNKRLRLVFGFSDLEALQYFGVNDGGA